MAAIQFTKTATLVLAGSVCGECPCYSSISSLLLFVDLLTLTFAKRSWHATVIYKLLLLYTVELFLKVCLLLQPPDTSKIHNCIPDEHYGQTLLAVSCFLWSKHVLTTWFFPLRYYWFHFKQWYSVNESSFAWTIGSIT